MQKIIEKIIGSSDDRILRRNINQNQRIMREFPWLWAVQREWEYQNTIMAVSNEDLTPFLFGKIKDAMGMADDHIYAVYIHGIRNLNGHPWSEFVRPIWDGNTSVTSVCQFPEQRWCQLLYSLIRNDNIDILHIVLAYWEGQALTIYRPKWIFG